VKKLTLLLIFISPFSQAQNLVPNPSFEDTINCPEFSGIISNANGWTSFSLTPDYLNSCAPPPVLNVPYADLGYQYAHSGNAMAGIITYALPSGSGGANAREHFGIQLQSPLVIGEKYFISFYVNYSGYGYPTFKRIACNKIGLKFTSTLVSDSLNPPPLSNWAHLSLDSIITDTLQWVRVSGSIIADSSYTHVIIGNFFDSVLTDTIDLGGMSFAAAGSYHYVDDICVSTDSLYNETWTNVFEQNESHFNFQLFPNPSHSFLNIQGLKPNSAITIYSSHGELLNFMINDFEDLILDVSNYSDGLYLIQVNTSTIITTKKFLIIKKQ
jgi:hypothetical protein